MDNKPTTPEDVASAVGDLIVGMTDNGYETDNLVTLLAAYTKLIEVMPKPYYQIIREEVQ